jgi:pimeloyl-ACP methyl ester carboxylesterase
VPAIYKRAMHDPTSAALRRVELPGVTLVYEDHGTGDRALVLVHGFTGSRDDFADVVPELTDLGRLVVVDQRGHGDSANPGAGYTLDQLADDLHGLLDAAGVARADLLGHSLGGMVALRFALAHPERMASLILMDSAARAVPQMAQALARAIASVRRHGTRRLVASVDSAPLSGEDLQIARIEGEERFRDRARAKLAALDPVAFTELATLLSDHPPIADRLAEIRCPTTVLVGANDAPFVPLADELARGIAGATLVTIDGAGHSPQKSGRAAWVAAVRAHLQRARGGQGA